MIALLCYSQPIKVDFADYQRLAPGEYPGAPVPPADGDIRAEGGRWFLDAANRAVIPRGVALHPAG
eukprot:gene1548-406_t